MHMRQESYILCTLHAHKSIFDCSLLQLCYPLESWSIIPHTESGLLHCVVSWCYAESACWFWIAVPAKPAQPADSPRTQIATKCSTYLFMCSILTRLSALYSPAKLKYRSTNTVWLIQCLLLFGQSACFLSHRTFSATTDCFSAPQSVESSDLFWRGCLLTKCNYMKL